MDFYAPLDLVDPLSVPVAPLPSMFLCVTCGQAVPARIAFFHEPPARFRHVFPRCPAVVLTRYSTGEDGGKPGPDPMLYISDFFIPPTATPKAKDE